MSAIKEHLSSYLEKAALNQAIFMVQEKLHNPHRHLPITGDQFTTLSHFLHHHQETNLYEQLRIEANDSTRTEFARLYLAHQIPPEFKTGHIPTKKPELKGLGIRFFSCILDLHYLLNYPHHQDFLYPTEDDSTHGDWLNPLHDDTGLMRHLMRSWTIAHLIYHHLAPHVSVRDRQALAKVAPAAGLHDLGRIVSHASDHDVILRTICQGTVANSILNTLHHPAPLTGDFNPLTFDNQPQVAGIHLPGIVRIADVNGKRISDKSNDFQLLTSPEALRDYSRAVQLSYLKRGDPIWTGKSEQDVAAYTEKEHQLFTFHTQRWLESYGFDWWKLAHEANQYPTITEDLLTGGGYLSTPL